MQTSLLRLTRDAAIMIVMIGAVAGAGRVSAFAQQTPPPAPPSTMAPPPPAAPTAVQPDAPPASTSAPATPPAAPPATPEAPAASTTPAAPATPATPEAPAASAAPAAPTAATPATSAETALTQALSAYEKQDFTAAADALKQAIEANPSSVEAHYYLGYALYKLKRFDESRVAFQKAYQLRSDYIPPIAPAKTK